MPSLLFPSSPATSISFASHHTMKSTNPKKTRHGPIAFPHPNSRPSKLHLAIKCGADKENMHIKNQIQLPGGLVPELMPKHMAVIMDGNRRWALKKGLPVQFGHRAGAQVLNKLSKFGRDLGIQVLTVFAFSTENWIRPKMEVEFLMNLFEETILSHMDDLMGDDVRVSVLGNISGLPRSLQKLIHAAEERAKANKGPRLVMAVNYSGRYDITEATRRIARKVGDGVLQVEDIDEAVLEQHLQTNGIEIPNPDLLLRTSGEVRLSNFMLWQLADTEMMFVDKCFPDLDEEDLVEVLTTFQRRQRQLTTCV